MRLRSRLPRRPPHVRHGSNAGQPLTRRDGVLKVTGRAATPPTTIPPACSTPSLAVSQHRARPRDRARRRGGQGASRRGRGDDAGQPAAAWRMIRTTRSALRASAWTCCRTTACATPASRSRVVIAETLEAATEGAALLAPRYEARAGAHRARRRRTASCRPPSASAMPAEHASRRCRGRACRRGARVIEATYETPAQYHNAMEPHAIVAAWDGDRLSLDMPNQGLALSAAAYRRAVRHPGRRTSIIRTPFLGGGFGSKALSTGRRSSASSPRAWSAGR